jgi:hypothetical protein
MQTLARTGAPGSFAHRATGLLPQRKIHVIFLHQPRRRVARRRLIPMGVRLKLVRP